LAGRKNRGGEEERCALGSCLLSLQLLVRRQRLGFLGRVGRRKRTHGCKGKKTARPYCAMGGRKYCACGCRETNFRKKEMTEEKKGARQLPRAEAEARTPISEKQLKRKEEKSGGAEGRLEGLLRNSGWTFRHDLMGRRSSRHWSKTKEEDANAINQRRNIENP